LRGIQQQLPEFQAAGIVPVAISVDPPEVSRDFAGKAGLTIQLLSDPDTKVIRNYHLLHSGAGPDGHDISRPAEFLLDPHRTVRWINLTEDLRVRARAKEILVIAKDLR
jgi:peroxiredoxin